MNVVHAEGAWRGLLLTDPACLPDAKSRKTDKIDAAYTRGYYLDERPISELQQIARAHQPHKDSTLVLHYLEFATRYPEVAVLFVWKGCIAYLLLKPVPDPDRNFPDARRRPVLDGDSLRAQLLGPEMPMVKKSHQDNPAKLAPRNRVVETSRHHDPGKAAPAPSGAANPDDRTPAVGRPRSKLGTFVLDRRLVRMVLRVPPELQEDLISLGERLFDETRLEYSYAAIIRGLIALGLAAIEGKASLAVEFAGARVPRGRKRGSTWNRSDHEGE
ncbi:MAG: hypothetical protein ACMG6S_27405 [Byssovorax sp.]